MTNDPQLAALHLFEALCDLSVEDIHQRLSAEPAEVRARVLEMIRVDRTRSGVLDDSRLLWAAAAELIGSEEPPAAAPPGYTLLHQLGAGGMGVVYEAQQEQPRRRVAVKILHAGGERAALRQRALSEAQALADVRHPCIPHIIEVGETSGLSFLVMELVDGIPLPRWGEPRTLRERLGAMIMVCQGVEAAHRAGVLHCDLKPANILVQEDGMPRILDFGLARTLQENGLERIGGTLAYMADEVLGGAPPSARSEVYSLGVVLHELLTGTRPFPDASIPSGRATLRLRRRSTQAAIPDTLPAALRAVLSRSLAEDPAHRYASPAALAGDLERFCADLPVLAYAGDWRYRGRLWAKRSRRGLRRVAAAAAGVGLLAGGWMAADGWQSTQQEAAAAERLASTTHHLDALWQSGAHSDAWQLVERFGSLPENIGTTAPSRLWAHLAVLIGGAEEERAAWAQSYIASTRRSDQARAADALLLHLQERQDWVALEQMLRGLPADLLEPARERTLRQQTHAAMRSLHEAAEADPDAAITPVLQALQGARRTDLRPIWIEEILWEGERLLTIVDQEQRRLWITRPDRTLTVLSEISLDGQTFGFNWPQVLPGDPPLLVGCGEGGHQDMRVWEIDVAGARLVERHQHTLPGRLHSVAQLGSMLYVSTYRSNSFLGLDLTDGSLRSMHPGLEGLDTLLTAAASDLTGDGRAELVVGMDILPGRAPLRIMDVDSSGGLTERAAIPMDGSVWPIPLTTASGGAVLLQVYHLDDGPELKLLGRRGEEIAVLHALKIPIRGDIALGHPVIGDFDGDGLEDIAVRLLDSDHHTFLLRQQADGSLDGVLLSNTAPLAAVQLDEDPADELLVRLVDDAQHLWILGLEGEGPIRSIEPIDPSLTGQDLPSGALEPARELVELGLIAEAAQTLELLAPSAPDAEQVSRQLLYAGRLYLAAELLDPARQSLEEALARLEHPSALREEIQAALVALLREDHRYGDIAALGEPVPLTVIEQDIPLSEIHRIARRAPVPDALRYQDSGLHFNTLGQDGVLLEIPLEASGEQLGFEADFELSYAEPGAWLMVEIVDQDGTILLGGGIETWGSDERADRAMSCMGPVEFKEGLFGTMSADFSGESLASVRVDLADGEVLCRLYTDRPGEIVRVARTREPLPAGRYTLRLRSLSPSPRYHACRIAGRLTSLRISGAAVLGGSVEPWVEPWMSSRLEEAFALASTDADRLLLLVRLGRLSELREVLGRLDLHGEAMEPLLLRELRLHPDVWIPILYDAAPALLAERYAQAWELPMLLSMTGDSVSALRHPRIDELPIGSPRQLRLHTRRAVVMSALDQPARARSLLERLLALPTLDPQSTRQLYHFLAEAHVQLGEDPAAACEAAGPRHTGGSIFADLSAGSWSAACQGE